MRRKRGVVTQSVICSILPLGYMSNGLPIYPIMGAEDDDGTGGGEDEDDEDEEDDDGEESKDKKSEEEKLPKPKRRAPANETPAQKIKRLNAENKERRETAEALQRELEERKNKDKTDLELAQTEAKKHSDENTTLREQLKASQIENAFLKFKDGKTRHEWQDPELVLDILNSKYELELNADGSIEGLAAAIKELAKTKPFLLANADSDEDGRDTRVRKAAGPSGGAPGSRKQNGGKEQAEKNKLLADYPVLSQGIAVT